MVRRLALQPVDQEKEKVDIVEKIILILCLPLIIILELVEVISYISTFVFNKLIGNRIHNLLPGSLE